MNLSRIDIAKTKKEIVDHPLDNVSIVIVDAKTPANIGAAARCMMNTGLSRLVLVRPPRDPQDDARRLSAGAHAILEQARLFDSLREAVADQALVLGTTRHAGRLRKNMQEPREAAARVLPLLNRNPTSIVFGNEVNGLERADLKLCHGFIAIPSSPAFPSLNLSHAVMVVAYEFFLASRSGPAPAEVQLAPEGDLERLYDHFRETLQRIGFLDPGQADRMMFSLRQIFGRARLDSRDVKILRGMLTAMDRESGRTTPR
jgi:TrmH family RNA methyltransferase